jgi:large subunit ribosomal protein L24
MKIKKGDKVKVMAGKDKGRESVVDRVYKKSGRVLIQKINIYKKHIKKSDKMPQGGTVEVPRPLDIAKVMLVCPKCGKTTRVGYKVEKSKKYRVCKKCESKLDK